MTAALQLPLTGVFEHEPGDAASEHSAIEFVLAGLPSVGHAPGTSRESLRRPVAEIYWREGASWHREQSKRHALEHPRADARRVAATHGDAQVWVSMLRTDFIEVVQFCERIEAGLVAAGATIQRAGLPTATSYRMTGALLDSIHQIVIAMCWEPAVAAGCFLASAVEPLGHQWIVELERAMVAGMPWGVRLAELSSLHGPLVRAWHWLHEIRKFDMFEECGTCGGHGMINGYENNVQDCECWQGMARKWT